ncbi:MAG TPA: hypothetical protein ENN84_08480, partial [Candidatus Marinimicrobia bacterium]|nr:hypothetical protein [Candidatus Neomarinimicrobiota bacterium]
GWRVPTDEDWKKLEIYLGMTQSQSNKTGWRGSDQGKKLKSKSGWDGTDIAGFGALPGGFRSYDNGSFYTVGYNAYFWSSSEVLSHHAWGRRLYGDYEEVDRYYYSRTYGFSVRCVRD